MKHSLKSVSAVGLLVLLWMVSIVVLGAMTRAAVALLCIGYGC